MSVPQTKQTASVGRRRRKTAQKLSAEQIAVGKHISARLNGMDVGEITRSSYSRKIGHFKLWCESNCPAALLGDKEHVKMLQEEARRNGEHEDYIVVYHFNTVYLEETYYACIHDYLTTYLNPATGMLFGWATYNVIKCALKKIWEWRPQSDEVTRGICPQTYNNSLDKTIRKIQSLNEADQKLGIRKDVDMAQEGITFTQYEEICNIFLQKGDVDSWFFLTMEFNLMCRINQVRDLTTTRIVWHGDALAIQFTKMKVTKKGAFHFNKHLYANPHNPAVCPITALGCFLLINGGTMDSFRLFSKYDDSKFIQKLKTAAQEANIPVNLTGSHALRKASWSHSQNGTTCSPSYAATCLRADHSLGNVKDRYNCGGCAQDQYLGRILAGLNPLKIGFGVLPPHFHISQTSRMLIRELFPAYKKWGSSFEPVLSKSLASVVYHYEFLIDKKTRLNNTAMFVNEVHYVKLKNQLVSTIPIYESKYLTPTGIPPHTALLIRLEKVTPNLRQMLNDVLDERDLGTGHVNRVYFDKKMSEKMSELQKIHKKLDALAASSGQRQLTNELLQGKKVSICVTT